MGEIEKWIGEVEKNYEDLYELGLAAFAKKNFVQAAKHFEDYTDYEIKQLQEIKRKKSELDEKEKQTTSKIIIGFLAAGDAYYANYQFEKALAQYEESMEFVSRDENPELWGSIQNYIGMANCEIGIRAEGDTVQFHLEAAVEAFKNALEIGTYEHLPMNWAQTQNNLAEAYFALKDWQNAVVCYVNVLKVYPNNEMAYKRADGLYHDVLFQFSEAFALDQKWLECNPEDLSARCYFAEEHFTTNRFEECEKQITALLASPDVDPIDKIVLRIIEISNLLALDKAQLVISRMDTLIETVASQPKNFSIAVNLKGTKHFINQTEKLKSYREWLMTLFNAVEGENQSKILSALREVKANFHYQ